MSRKKKLCEGCYYNLDDDVCISHSYFHGYDIDGNLLHFDTYGKKIEWLRKQAQLCLSGCNTFRSAPFLTCQKKD